MKKNSCIFCIIGAIIAIGAIVAAIIVFRTELTELFYQLHDKINEKRAPKCDEFSDYADV